MEKKVCVFLADGFEEIEGLTVVDLLRRAGIFVTTVSITGKLQIRGSHDICAFPLMVDFLLIPVYNRPQGIADLKGENKNESDCTAYFRYRRCSCYQAESSRA